MSLSQQIIDNALNEDQVTGKQDVDVRTAEREIIINDIKERIKRLETDMAHLLNEKGLQKTENVV